VTVVLRRGALDAGGGEAILESFLIICWKYISGDCHGPDVTGRMATSMENAGS